MIPVRSGMPWRIARNWFTLSALVAICSPVLAQPQIGPPRLTSSPAKAELRILSTEFKFTQPSTPIVAGRPVAIVLDNSRGETEHLIMAPALGLRIFARAGEVTTKEYVFDKPGEYEFVCDLPGHLEAGMKGRLVVVAKEDDRTKWRGAARN